MEMYFKWTILYISATGLLSTMLSCHVWSTAFQALAFISHRTQSALITMTNNGKISGMHLGLCVKNLYFYWLSS